MNIIVKYILQFFFYSAVGWAVESTYCSFGEKRLINRGFLTGPMCPIYGTGSLVMTVFLYNPFYDRPLMVFLLGMLLCDIVEYITSVLMEVLFHSRWWDYTYEFLNIKGRICLKHTLFWGIASIGFVYIIHPFVDGVLDLINPTASIILLVAVLLVFAIDVVHSFVKALDIRQLQVKLNKLIETVSGGLDSVKATIEDKIEQHSSDKQGVSEQTQDIFHQFELRFSKKANNKKEKNKYSSRFFHNGLNIEKDTRKRLDKLKSLIDEIKANIFENNGDMQ